MSLGALVTVALAAAPAAGARVLDPALDPSEAYTESFTWVADLDDGTYVQAQLVVTNVGIGTARGGCRALVVEPGAAPWTANRLVPRAEWHTDSAPSPALHVGTCEAHAGAASYAIVARLDGVEVAVTLASPPAPVTPPDNPLRLGSRFYDSEVVVPFAAAEVRLTRGGGPARVVRGHGYADHSRSTALPGQLASAWLRFRSTAPACPTLLLLRVPAGATEAHGWLWRGGDGPTPLTAAPGLVDRASAPVGQPFEVTTSAGELRVSPRVTLHRYDPVAEHGLVGHIVSAWVGRDVTTTYRGRVTGVPGCDEATGILELSRIN